MKIVVDENIPQAAEAFQNFGNLKLLKGRMITNAVLSEWTSTEKDADILIVRSVTKVDENLLKGTNIKFVGTATSGIDHIDVEYLKRNGIEFADAAGCNSYPVAEYVIAAIVRIFLEKKWTFHGKTLGVIGVGKIGSKVAAFGEALGFNVLKNDPPLQRKTGSNEYVTLDEILKCDVITLHVPLSYTGIDKTLNIISKEKIERLKKDAVLINTSRGEVIDNLFLKKELKEGKPLSVVLDVWENEPSIDFELMNLVSSGTPHIAGYSLEGKVNGTEMIYKKLCRYLGCKMLWRPKFPKISEEKIILDESTNLEEALSNIFLKIYDIGKDDRMLREGIRMKKEARIELFDELRKNYYVRREFNNYTIKLISQNEQLATILEALRFKVVYTV